MKHNKWNFRQTAVRQAVLFFCLLVLLPILYAQVSPPRPYGPPNLVIREGYGSRRSPLLDREWLNDVKIRLGEIPETGVPGTGAKNPISAEIEELLPGYEEIPPEERPVSAPLSEEYVFPKELLENAGKKPPGGRKPMIPLDEIEELVAETKKESLATERDILPETAEMSAGKPSGEKVERGTASMNTGTGTGTPPKMDGSQMPPKTSASDKNLFSDGDFSKNIIEPDEEISLEPLENEIIYRLIPRDKTNELPAAEVTEKPSYKNSVVVPEGFSEKTFEKQENTVPERPEKLDTRKPAIPEKPSVGKTENFAQEMQGILPDFFKDVDNSNEEEEEFKKEEVAVDEREDETDDIFSEYYEKEEAETFPGDSPKTVEIVKSGMPDLPGLKEDTKTAEEISPAKGPDKTQETVDIFTEKKLVLETKKTAKPDEKNVTEKKNTGTSGKTSLPPPAVSKSPRKHPPLTETEKELAARVQRTLEVYRKISMATGENSPSDIMLFVIPYGCKATVYQGFRESEKPINAVGALCWNMPMRQQVVFNPAGKELMPNVGYGIQRYPGQLLATFALSRVSVDYEFPARSSADERAAAKKAGQAPPRTIYSVNDLVELEKKRCRTKTDLSFALIGLSYYLDPDVVWEDRDGRLWTLEKMVYYELKRKPNTGSAEITNQLLGLTCALRCRKQKSNEPLSPIYQAAEKYLAEYRAFALRNQNAWHCWHPSYFEYRGVSTRRRSEMLFASANIMRWLVLDTPTEELSSPEMIRGIDILERLTFDHVRRWDPAGASAKEVEGVSAALHALMIYQKRYFEPRK